MGGGSKVGGLVSYEDDSLGAQYNWLRALVDGRVGATILSRT